MDNMMPPGVERLILTVIAVFLGITNVLNVITAVSTESHVAVLAAFCAAFLAVSLTKICRSITFPEAQED